MSTSPLSSPKLGIIGNGNMAMAIIRGLLKVGFNPKNIWLSGPHLEKLQTQAAEFGVNITTNNTFFLAQTQTLILAVKPNVMASVCAQIGGSNTLPLLISIAAGIQTQQIQHWTHQDCAIIRAMPNTPSMLQQGATGLYANAFTTQAHKTQCEQMLQSIGLVQWIEDENQMDIVTALSGSGPAYFYYMMEAMIESAQQLGLNKDTATQLTIQTALGAANMAKQSNLPLQTLRENVTSKGGTTEAGLNSLNNQQFKQCIFNAIESAYLRGQELSQKQNILKQPSKE